MENSIFVEELRKKRREYGVTQDALSAAVGLSRKYLIDIEKGRVNLKEERQMELLEMLEKFNSELPLTMLFDYVRIRFRTQDIKHVAEDVMQLDLDFLAHDDYGFYGYSEKYYIGNVLLMSSPKPNMGVLLELKGQGCRQFECYLEAQKRTWYDFFEQAVKENCVIKRMDLAINDRAGMLDIPELVRKCDRKEWKTKFRTYKSYHSGENLYHDSGKKKTVERGHTLYLGSMNSEIYFCIYEKDYEQYVKKGIPLEETDIKNRFEIRLCNERAEKAMEDLLKHRNAEKTAFGIINKYVTFLDKEKGKKRESWKMNAMWEHFCGKNREKIKLTVKPEEYSVEKTLEWLAHQVAPSLKVLEEADEKNGTSYIKNIMDSVELKERHKKMLEHLTSQVEEVVIH